MAASASPWLLLGATGQVGFELARTLWWLGDGHAPDRIRLDLSDLERVEAWLAEHRPAVVVNAAAYTAVDQAEQESSQAFLLNARLPALLADYCAAQGALLVHYSSDYVYSGEGNTPWREGDVARPLSVYGRSKLAGDQAIIDSGCDHLIFRTSWVYSERGHNFVKTMLRLGSDHDSPHESQHDSLRVVSDQLGVPTSARMIAEATSLALQRYRQDPSVAGLYHLAPRGTTSWHGVACEIFRQGPELGHALRMTPDRVVAIASDDYPTSARRPLNSRLDASRFATTFEVTLPSWQALLRQTLQTIHRSP